MCQGLSGSGGQRGMCAGSPQPPPNTLWPEAGKCEREARTGCTSWELFSSTCVTSRVAPGKTRAQALLEMTLKCVPVDRQLQALSQQVFFGCLTPLCESASLLQAVLPQRLHFAGCLQGAAQCWKQTSDGFSMLVFCLEKGAWATPQLTTLQ